MGVQVVMNNLKLKNKFLGVIQRGKNNEQRKNKSC